MKKSNNDLCEEILDIYFNNESKSSIQDLINKLPIMIEDNLCYKFSKKEWIGFAENFYYRFFSMYIQKYNKNIKKFRRHFMPYEFGNNTNISVTSDPKFIKLTKYILEDGKYFAKINENTYIILTLLTTDGGIVETNFYIIGKKWNKVKKKINKELKEYTNYTREDKNERIRNVSDRKSITTIFKSFDSLILKNKKDIIKYIDNWVECIPIYYNKYHIIPKLSILLYGEPGTGKTTFAKCLAKYLGLKNINAVTPDYFNGYYSKNNNYNYEYDFGIPGVIAIDDIDCVCSSRKDQKNKNNLEITSKVLAFLDTPPTFEYKAKDGIMYPVSIVVATTNYLDRLDPAVTRFGRFDLTIKMEYLNKKEAKEMCDLYNLDLSIIAKNTNNPNFRISPAELEALCLSNLDKKLKMSGKEIINGRILIHRKNRKE